MRERQTDRRRTPRWVLVFVAVGVVAVVLLVVALLSGHGPGRHMQNPQNPGEHSARPHGLVAP